ncbi:MAG: c-type cytochrome [Mucilaginibacter polytrichastri]|nr:c-type cytochrome [Mucilaginibacter polytrichastri]
MYFALLTAACIALLLVLFDRVMSGPNEHAKKTGEKGMQVNAGINRSAVKHMRELPVSVWKAPDVSAIPAGKKGDQIRYGRGLIANTAKYFGPKGSVAAISNGMNCQNCHLDAGARPFANDYASFTGNFPKHIARSGKVEPATARIAECFSRSLNGSVPDTNSREIRAMLAYMQWLAANVKRNEKAVGSGTEKLHFLDRAADPVKGVVVYRAKCQTCHGADGEGVPAADKLSYTYPPLWGENSYNDGAGMYRLGNFAGFVKNNMPFGAGYEDPQLTDEEAWDVAAFVNSRPRPHRDASGDYPDPEQKPVDAPYGPYADHFSAEQHKYGPFQPIADARKKSNEQ